MNRCNAAAPFKILLILNENCTPEEQIHLALIFVEAVRQMHPQMREAWFDMNQFNYVENTPVNEFCCTIERHPDEQFQGIFSTQEKSLQLFSDSCINESFTK